MIGDSSTKSSAACPKKRKGYLLAASMLTFQGLVERVLEVDGITREMIQAQQAKLNLCSA
jgi:hypothetical protein